MKSTGSEGSANTDGRSRKPRNWLGSGHITLTLVQRRTAGALGLTLLASVLSLRRMSSGPIGYWACSPGSEPFSSTPRLPQSCEALRGELQRRMSAKCMLAKDPAIRPCGPRLYCCPNVGKCKSVSWYPKFTQASSTVSAATRWQFRYTVISYTALPRAARRYFQEIAKCCGSMLASSGISFAKASSPPAMGEVQIAMLAAPSSRESDTTGMSRFHEDLPRSRRETLSNVCLPVKWSNFTLNSTMPEADRWSLSSRKTASPYKRMLLASPAVGGALPCTRNEKVSTGMPVHRAAVGVAEAFPVHS
mmetsp:Transcript_14926/g.52383  ORF Transcript_14926/g.52383 Transcript_14926/m.52383 type:complete len:305 (-) Transcript_14926:1297-2211(-)